MQIILESRDQNSSQFENHYINPITGMSKEFDVFDEEVPIIAELKKQY